MALTAAGLAYARAKDIPAWAALPVLAAFLIEYPFYLAAGFAAVRDRLAGPRLPWLLTGSALAPYLIYSIGTGQFRLEACAQLAVLAAIISFWYVVLPRGVLTDLAYLALLAVVLLRKFFDAVYSQPMPRLDVDVLGHLALIHIAAIAILVQRGAPGTGFGFLPRREEWLAGLRWFLYFIPIGFPLALWLGVVRWDPSPVAWKVAGTFIGFLWVVALSEEFFFRGLLQQWLEKWTGNMHAGLIAASVLFGLAHLGFRQFPNWRFVAVAAVAGWFYGRAFQTTRSIRASMVTHALVVTTWRAMFQ